MKKPKKKPYERVVKVGEVIAGASYTRKHVDEIVSEFAAFIQNAISGPSIYDRGELDQFLNEKIDAVWQEGFEDGWNDRAENPPE